jgi:CSLREA domain-containing protein
MTNHTTRFSRRLSRLLTSLALLLVPVSASALTLTVTSTLDSADALPGNGVCDNGSGQCTLRAAIQEANALAGSDTIAFNIGAGGVQTISPASALPGLSSTIAVDGTTQPGFTNTPLIQLEGSSAPAGTSGLVVTGSGSSIRGLVVNRFASSLVSGIRVLTSGVVIAGNYIGTDTTGTLDLGNFRGISLQGATNCQVGGTSSADRNVISGNLDGIAVTSSATGNTIQGNRIGTDVSGTLAIPNDGGINVFNASNTQIGGPAFGQGNVISGNAVCGVLIQGNTAFGNKVQGNRIGTQANGTSALGNASQGVWLRNLTTASLTVVGGLLPNEGNAIAFNGLGVEVSGAMPSTGNSILGNSIHSNTSLAIDLEVDGVTANDAGDIDGGTNGRQNFPVLASAFETSTDVVATGSLASLASTLYHIELFSNSTCDPSGNGEGETPLATFDAATDASGNLEFSESFAGSIAVGSFVTATATDPDGNTSEFAECIEVLGCPATPEPGCLDSFGSAKLAVSDKKAGKESLKIGLSKGPAFEGDDLGNPLAPGGTDYFVCIYNGAGALAQQYAVARAGDTCDGKPCWSSIGSIPPGDVGHKGYKYKDALITSDGIAGMSLKPGGAGKSKIGVKGKNNSAKSQTSLPTGVAAALAGSSSVIVQLTGSDATSCVSATLGNVSQDDGSSFKASN